MHIGLALRDLRRVKGVTQAQLGERVDVSRNHICEIENGNGMPSVELLQDILFELGYGMKFIRLKSKGQPPNMKNL